LIYHYNTRGNICDYGDKYYINLKALICFAEVLQVFAEWLVLNDPVTIDQLPNLINDLFRRI